MEQTLTFYNQCINKNKLNMCELPININKVNTEKIVLFNKELYKYIIGYKINDNIIPLCVKLSKINAYSKYYNDNLYMNFLLNDKEILKNILKYKVKLDNEPVYNNVYIKSKINLDVTKLYGNNLSLLDKNYAHFSVILLDSISNVYEKYYPQILLKRMLTCNKKYKKYI